MSGCSLRWESCSRKKLPAQTSASTIHCAKVFYVFFPFRLTEYLLMCTQGLRFNKINTFYCLIRRIIKWNWYFFFCECIPWRTQWLAVDLVPCLDCFDKAPHESTAGLHHLWSVNTVEKKCNALVFVWK